MNKLYYCATLAAVPVMVASAEVEFTARERIQVCELASACIVVRAVESDEINMGEKIEVA